MMNEEKVITNEQNAPQYDFDSREMLRYNANKISSSFGLLAMVFSIFGAFICLNSMNPNNAQVIFIILLNVVVLLGGFLASEKVKAYKKSGAIAQMVFGGICVARIFYIPFIIIFNYAKFLNSIEFNDASKRWEVVNEELYNGAASNLGATVTSKYIGNVANAYLPASGYFRGISAMVLFVLAAACFIYAGIHCYKKAQELEFYMGSIEKK